MSDLVVYKTKDLKYERRLRILARNLKYFVNKTFPPPYSDERLFLRSRPKPKPERLSKLGCYLRYSLSTLSGDVMDEKMSIDIARSSQRCTYESQPVSGPTPADPSESRPTHLMEAAAGWICGQLRCSLRRFPTT